MPETQDQTASDSPSRAPETSAERVNAAQAEWKQAAKNLNGLASAFGPLAKEDLYRDLKKLKSTLDKVAEKTHGLVPDGSAEALLKQLRGDLGQRRKNMQERLAADLQEACRESGLELKVLRREQPVEIRIPPFAVRIDRDKGQAQVLFARLVIIECEAQAQAILRAREQALANLGHGFDGEVFFVACFKAWKAACAAGSSERVEISDYLAYLALQLQSKAFRLEPVQKNFKGYTRARFAFDLMQLRAGVGLRRDGWRMNLGVATGTTASKKNRAIFIEDEYGEGEFKLTIFFTKEASPGGENHR